MYYRFTDEQKIANGIRNTCYLLLFGQLVYCSFQHDKEWDIRLSLLLLMYSIKGVQDEFGV